MTNEQMQEAINFVLVVLGVQISLMLIWNDPTPEAITAGLMLVPIEVLYIMWLVAKQDWISWIMEIRREISTFTATRKMTEIHIRKSNNESTKPT